MSSWTPGQKLFVAVFPCWDECYDEAPILNETQLWRVIRSILDKRELEVIWLRFGRTLEIGAPAELEGEGMTLAQIGRCLYRVRGKGFGVSKERARQIEAKALRKLRGRSKLLKEAGSWQTIHKLEKAWQRRTQKLQRLGINISERGWQ